MFHFISTCLANNIILATVLPDVWCTVVKVTGCDSYTQCVVQVILFWRQQRHADDWGSFKIKDFKHSKYDNYKVWRSQVDEGDNRHFCLCICLKVTQLIAKEMQNIIVSQPLTLGFPPNRNQSITTTRNKSKPEQNQNKTRTKLFLRLQYLVFLSSICKYF